MSLKVIKQSLNTQITKNSLNNNEKKSFKSFKILQNDVISCNACRHENQLIDTSKILLKTTIVELCAC